MSTVGKLSSYFTKNREDRSSSAKSCKEGSGKPIKSVRARLEKKLHAQQKTGFAFNFAVESDEADLQEDKMLSGASAGGQRSFRFAFDPSSTNEIGASTLGESRSRGGGGGATRRADQGFSIEVEQQRAAQPHGKNKPRKKRAGKKKKRGKGKGKAAEQKPPQELTAEPSEPAVIAGPPIAVGDGGGKTGNSLLSLPITAAKDGNSDSVRREQAPLRPPPGFTLESWKDPTLSGEERRRRRFGSGVRNMAAIQRRSDARRDMAANDDLDIEGSDLPCTDRETTLGVVSVGVPADATSGVGGGSSVFAFGFDIGISFDGGT
ncbi:unnamed protein product [Hapterophycus canaliculatus]